MKVLCLNLPHAGGRLQRRFVASYYAPNFLVPPIELMGLASIAREWHGAETRVLDAIALGWGIEPVLAEIGRWRPDLVVALAGFGCYDEDLGYLARIREACPDVKLAAFGYLPSQRPHEAITRAGLDALFCDEPEMPFSGWLDALAGKADPGQVAGLVTRRNGDVLQGPPPARLADLDRLPFPDHSLVERSRYSESFIGGPIAAVLSARGCPYACTYCVRMYGRQFVTRSADNILAELEHLARNLAIRKVRFMDDTFTLVPERLKAICRGMLDRGLGLTWTCLTRLDRLDPEGLELMRASGCRRLYCGVESGSQRLLDRWKKGASLETMERQIRLARRHGLEVSAFFIVGAPDETEDDFRRSVDFAVKSGVDYVIVTRLQYWPGTELYEDRGGGTPPSANDADYFAREREFYRRFYLRPAYVARRLGHLLRTPRDMARGFLELVRYVRGARPGRDFI